MIVMSCYEINSNAIETWNKGTVPCNINVASSTITQQCCQKGDTCLGSSICYFTHPQENASGFYVGGCTQESFPGPMCSKECSEYLASPE